MNLSMWKVHNEDCLDYLKTLADNSIDLIITDPPYEIHTSGGGMYKAKDKRYIKELNGLKNGFAPEVLDELVRIMKKINIYIFCSQKQILPLLKYFVEEKKCNYNILTWHKSNPIPACGNKYITDTEYILFFRERGVKIYGSASTKLTYFITPLNTKDKKLYNHPTCKPVSILENLVVNSSCEGDTILDPFMGSGSTGVACVKHGRKFIGIEKIAEYCEVAKERLANATN
jgi:DNA modification methylase